jgi:hypothetical protein
LPTVRSAAKDFGKITENEIPGFLVRLRHVITRKTGVHESHQSTFSLFLEGHCNRRFLSQGFP